MEFIIWQYGDIIMGTIASQITCLTIVYSTVYSDTDQRKHQSSPSLAFVWGIHRGPVNSQHKWPIIRKMFPFDDVIMKMYIGGTYNARVWWNHQLQWCHISAQPLAKANNKESIKAPHYWPLSGEYTSGFPAQRASNMASVSLSWCHHVWWELIS